MSSGWPQSGGVELRRKPRENVEAFLVVGFLQFFFFSFFGVDFLVFHFSLLSFSPNVV